MSMIACVLAMTIFPRQSNSCSVNWPLIRFTSSKRATACSGVILILPEERSNRATPSSFSRQWIWRLMVGCSRHIAFGKDRSPGSNSYFAHAGEVASGADCGSVYRPYDGRVQYEKCSGYALDSHYVLSCDLMSTSAEHPLLVAHVANISAGAECAPLAGEDRRPDIQIRIHTRDREVFIFTCS